MPALGPKLTVAYAGLIPINFHTFTNAYPSFNGAGWDFNDHSLLPMEFHGFQSGGPIGLYARLIDLNTGYTTITIGDNTPAHENNSTFGMACWQDNLLQGWARGSATGISPVNYAYPAILGQNYSAPSLQFNSGYILPLNISNTGFPYAYANMNWPCKLGAAVSCTINLNPFYGAAKNGKVTCQLAPALNIADINYGTQNVIGPYNSPLYGIWSFMQLANPAVNLDRHRFLFTDFQSYASPIYEVHFENPPGGFDLDSYVTDWGNGKPFATESGFILISKNTVTIGTQILNGFGVLILPDYSAYYILQLIPRDTFAATWTTIIGQFHAKIDRSGALWMLNPNFQNILFVSAGNVLKQLPIFYPVPLSDSADLDPVVQMMRSFQP